MIVTCMRPLIVCGHGNLSLVCLSEINCRFYTPTQSCIAAKLCDCRPIAAYHFCKHGYADRSDPMRMLQSLAHQLATRIPALRDTYLASSDTIAQAVKGGKLEEAFKQLLLKPLRQLDKDGGLKEPLVLLIDALDEAQVGFLLSLTFLKLKCP